MKYEITKFRLRPDPQQNDRMLPIYAYFTVEAANLTEARSLAKKKKIAWQLYQIRRIK